MFLNQKVNVIVIITKKNNNNFLTPSSKTVRYRRAPSIILISSDDENDQQSEQKNGTMQTQYATPMVQMDTTTNVSTTDASLLQPVRIDPLVIEDNNNNSSIESPCGLAQRNYLPYTITAFNQQRLSILPIYPSVNDDNDDDDGEKEQEASFLLLASLPNNQLSERERERRRTGLYKCQFSIIGIPDPTLSFLLQQYTTYYGSIIERFNIDLAILDFNYLRLKKFIQLSYSASIRILPSGQSANMDYHLQDEELPQLLEFFLQIDIDLFYMKTCSFRGAKPRAAHEGIFCLTIPEIRYVMKPCNRCALCHSSNQTTTYSVTFNLYQKHRFVNGYESILNCPASCQTNNIIYVLTCQCGDYDYIGETSGTLLQRLSSHQCIMHRLILERLIGDKNYVRFWGAKTNEMTKKDGIRLYQHPIHCSIVLQTFLNQNTDYWIFIPLPEEDADRENHNYTSSSTSTNIATLYDKNSMIQQLLLNIPKPPANFKFSNLQNRKQYEFFLKKYYQQQTSLNYPLNTPLNRYVWCVNLHRPRF
jgi:hypothetical protein